MSEENGSTQPTQAASELKGLVRPDGEMEKYINQHGKECYRNATFESVFSGELFHEVPRWEDDYQFALHTNLGSLTVLDRMTGFGWRDIEAGYRDPEGKFWLASGGFDVRDSESKTIGEAIAWVKERANNCIGDGPA